MSRVSVAGCRVAVVVAPMTGSVRRRRRGGLTRGRSEGNTVTTASACAGAANALVVGTALLVA
jgi:hypothetical protein